ncbi:hypothetical protein SELMODRAFT_422326 [Selaginella moellendorffii]|uniref:Uncharacterized protein n=1 Tax=Selaginella moellendorffii TaxID=88036 RepID=D8SI21_SELML|nr:hypothetical protein SELMODRAFT_422326 [Selaginella moellendorffii]
MRLLRREKADSLRDTCMRSINESRSRLEPSPPQKKCRRFPHDPEAAAPRVSAKALFFPSALAHGHALATGTHLPTAATAGKEISKKRMEDEKTWVWNCVIRDYGMLGRVECTREAFLQCPARNFLSWKLLADAYAHKGHYWKVLEIEDKIPAVMYQLAPPPPSSASIFDAVSLYQKGKRWAAWELLQ